MKQVFLSSHVKGINLPITESGFRTNMQSAKSRKPRHKGLSEAHLKQISSIG